MSKFSFLTQNRPFIKVIAGLTNFDSDRVKLVAESAVEAGVPAIDIAADAELINLVKSHTTLTVFVSGLTADTLITAAKAGADVVELGNFDSVYAKGETVSAEGVLSLTRDVLAGIPAGVLVCVTIPGLLGRDEQISLATQLQAMGVHFVQLEVLSGRETEALSIATAISGLVEIPVILAGGITIDNVITYAETGVSGLGIGRTVSQLTSGKAMVETLKALLVAAGSVIERKAVASL